MSKILVIGQGVDAARWERVFGPEAQRQERFRAAIEAQKKRDAAAESDVPAVHDSRPYGDRGLFSPCLPREDCYVKSRAHGKELARRYGLLKV